MVRDKHLHNVEVALVARDVQARAPVLRAKKSGKNFRVGIFLDFVWLTTRTMHPHGAYVRRARRNRIDPHGGEIERLVTRTTSPARGSTPALMSALQPSMSPMAALLQSLAALTNSSCSSSSASRSYAFSPWSEKSRPSSSYLRAEKGGSGQVVH